MARGVRYLSGLTVVSSLVDVGLLVFLRQGLGWMLVPANVCAIAAASVLSYFLHRAVTFRSDPYVRWIHVPIAFIAVAAVAALVDVTVLRIIFAVTGFESTLGLVTAKLVALACAAVIRLLGYRSFLRMILTRARRERGKRPPAPGTFRLSVVVPAYHEADRIAVTARTLRTGLSGISGTNGLEIVVVDDGSTDGTGEAALQSADVDQVVFHPHNRGKGAAVRTGMLASRGRTLVFTDADLAYSPDQVGRILRAIEDGWDVAIGNRRHPGKQTVVDAVRLRAVGSRVINLLSHVVLLGAFHDTQCGLKGCRSDVGRFVFSRVRVDGFAFDIEVLHLVERHRLSLIEIPVVVAHSSRSTVRFKDAFRLLWDLFRIRHWSATGRYESTEDWTSRPQPDAIPSARPG